MRIDPSKLRREALTEDAVTTAMAAILAMPAADGSGRPAGARPSVLVYAPDQAAAAEAAEAATSRYHRGLFVVEADASLPTGAWALL